MRTVTKLGLLTSLYLSQGLPYGFFTVALPVVMRKEHMSLALIGASAILAAPWGLKFLWAPLVDRWSGSPLGPRRGWIVPLQLITVVMALALAFARDLTSIGLIMAGGLLVMNFLAATQDIATDGFAVGLLSPEERGHGNAVQVAAYRIGMILGGGVLVKVFADAGWQTTFTVMAGILALATLPIALFRETPKALAPSSSAEAEDVVSYGAVLTFLRRPGVALWIVLICAYKFGDALPGPMARTMLVDKGYSLDDIGELFGIGGSVAGFAGALIGGFLAKRRRLLALVVAAA